MAEVWMERSDVCTLVISYDDNPASSEQLLVNLVGENSICQLSLRVLFLASSSEAGSMEQLEEFLRDERFASLHPSVLQASRGRALAEENILHILGENLDVVDHLFLIIGNADRVNIGALQQSIRYLLLHQLDLLLVGVMAREVYKSEIMRQVYRTPRHINGAQRLGPESFHGSGLFSDALSDYGVLGYLAYTGCQLYTKKFFHELCSVLSRLPEPLYAIPLATLELTSEQEWNVGFVPDVVVIQVDELRYGSNCPELPLDSWIVRHRTERGLSAHLLLSAITNSLHLSADGFMTLVDSRMVVVTRGAPNYVFTSFLFVLVGQMREWVRSRPRDPDALYSAGELRDIQSFGKRLGGVANHPSNKHLQSIGAWFQDAAILAQHDVPDKVAHWLSKSADALKMLDRRPGKQQWVASLL